MRQAVPSLERASPERRRDELFKILEGPQPAAAIHALDRLAALPYVLPELLALKGIEQSPPHISDVWTHTLAVLQQMEAVLEVLGKEYNPDKTGNLFIGMLTGALGRFRGQFYAHLSQNLNVQRSIKGLLMLAALYHDISKPETWQKDEMDRIHNLGHEHLGAEVVERLGRSLFLSNDEIARLAAIVRNHMRIHSLVQTGSLPSRRAVYRFFRDTGEAGVDVCLLTLADTLATYGPGLPVEVWTNHLEACRVLLEAWWEKPTETVSPPRLVDGNDLQRELGLAPGPLIGQLLEAIREAQAERQIQDREQALTFAREWVQANPQ
jgi:putative nucleotidyltransferase with HDIG domain